MSKKRKQYPRETRTRGDTSRGCSMGRAWERKVTKIWKIESSAGTLSEPNCSAGFGSATEQDEGI